MASAGRAGIATSATALGRDTWDAPVREVRMMRWKDGEEEDENNTWTGLFGSLYNNWHEFQSHIFTIEMSKLANYSH